MYGNPEVTAGGNALKFYSSVRIDIRRKEILKENDGIMVKIKVVKNKVWNLAVLRTCILSIYIVETPWGTLHHNSLSQIVLITDTCKARVQCTLSPFPLFFFTTCCGYYFLQCVRVSHPHPFTSQHCPLHVPHIHFYSHLTLISEFRLLLLSELSSWIYYLAAGLTHLDVC